MPRNTIKDPSAVLTSFVNNGHADSMVTRPNAKGLFAYSKANRFYVARLDPKAKGAVRIYKSDYPTLSAAIAKVPDAEVIAHPKAPSNVPDDVAAIIRYCATDDARVASHLHGEYFVVTKVHPRKGSIKDGERRWYPARVHNGKVQVEGTGAPSRGAALVAIERKGGLRPTKSLQNVPSYPLQLYFTA